jgi:hypothetical protein
LAGSQKSGSQQEVAVVTVLHQPTEVRTLVFQTFLEFDVSEASLARLEERMMVDDGRYVARSYRAEDLMAMWLVEVGLLQFYDSEGNMLRTINLFDECQPQYRAA